MPEPPCSWNSDVHVLSKSFATKAANQCRQLLIKILCAKQTFYATHTQHNYAAFHRGRTILVSLLIFQTNRLNARLLLITENPMLVLTSLFNLLNSKTKRAISATALKAFPLYNHCGLWIVVPLGLWTASQCCLFRSLSSLDLASITGTQIFPNSQCTAFYWNVNSIWWLIIGMGVLI